LSHYAPRGRNSAVRNAKRVPFMLDDPLFRAGAATAYRDILIAQLGYKTPVVRTGEDLIKAAAGVDPAAVEAARGWRTEPPFPGSYGPLEEMPEQRPGWKLICACKLFSGDQAAGVIFTTFVSGRPAGIFVNGPDYPLPPNFQPLR
jgi:hypothetical protein